MLLSKIISSNSAISPRKALLAYDFVVQKIKYQEKVVISLEGIEDFTSAFSNAFIGKLYMDFGPDFMDHFLEITDFPCDGIWKNKVENAIYLGSNSEFRDKHNQNLSELLVS